MKDKNLAGYGIIGLIFALMIGSLFYASDVFDSESDSNKKGGENSEVFGEGEDVQKQDFQKQDYANVYLFHSVTCPHCVKAKSFLETIEDKSDLYFYEVNEGDNADKWLQVLDLLEVPEVQRGGVPFIIVGDQYWVGYGSDETIGAEIEARVDFCNQNSCSDNVVNFLGGVEGEE